MSAPLRKISKKQEAPKPVEHEKYTAAKALEEKTRYAIQVRDQVMKLQENFEKVHADGMAKFPKWPLTVIETSDAWLKAYHLAKHSENLIKRGLLRMNGNLDSLSEWIRVLAETDDELIDAVSHERPLSGSTDLWTRALDAVKLEATHEFWRKVRYWKGILTMVGKMIDENTLPEPEVEPYPCQLCGDHPAVTEVVTPANETELEFTIPICQECADRIAKTPQA
jgi:aryl carrier-like protein